MDERRSDRLPETWEASPWEHGPLRRRPTKLLWAARIVFTLLFVTFSFLGPIMGTRSVDLPAASDSNERYGFHRHTVPHEWVCGSGHTHRSVPFWWAAIGFAAVAGIVWFLLPRTRKPAS